MFGNTHDFMGRAPRVFGIIEGQGTFIQSLAVQGDHVSLAPSLRYRAGRLLTRRRQVGVDAMPDSKG